VIKARALRRKAAQFRQIASVPRHGNSLVNRDLLLAAKALAQQADAREELLKAQGEPEPTE